MNINALCLYLNFMSFVCLYLFMKQVKIKIKSVESKIDKKDL